MSKRYVRPSVTSIEIPERTAYACNVYSGYTGGGSCPHISNVVGYAICTPNNFGKFGIGTCT